MTLLITTPKAWTSTFAPPIWMLIFVKARFVFVFLSLSHDIPQFRPSLISLPPISMPSIAATATAVSGLAATTAASSGLT